MRVKLHKKKGNKSNRNKNNHKNKKIINRFNRRSLIMVLQFFIPNKTNKRINQKENH